MVLRRYSYIWGMRANAFFIALPLLLLFSCRSAQQKDLLVFGGSIHRYGTDTTTHPCMVVHDGKVLELGTEEELRKKYTYREEIDLKGRSVYPGFHDAHSHFVAMGKGISELNLKYLHSWDSCFDKIKAYVEANPHKTWIIGRGWDQNLWEGKNYPDRRQLDSAFPGKYFYLSRVDGHAALVSGNLLERAGIGKETSVAGGQILKRENGELSGILMDAAADRSQEFIPSPEPQEIREFILAAEKECLQYGLTAITEAGLSLQVVQIIDSMQKEGKLRMKVVAMLNPGPEEFAFARENGIYETPGLKVASFKLYADGALGSRGAFLKKPYCDHSGQGLPIHNTAYFDSVCKLIYDYGYQANTHCIGDSANSMILGVYGHYLKGKNEKRWRIEHAQVLDLKDLPFFAAYSIIPSVQPTHATSDMPWAEQRLCSDRLPGAYAYQTLLQTAGCIALGTDFPVEEVNPFYTYLSAVYRMNAFLEPGNGYRTEQALSPFHTLKGMTWWASEAGFVEHLYGGLLPGQAADFFILEKEIEKYTPQELVKARPAEVRIDGTKV